MAHIHPATQNPAVMRLMALPVDDVFEVYFTFIESDPEIADTPAFAIRERARAGALSKMHVDVLEMALASAPSLLVVAHLAKAAAAIGRDAQALVPTLCEQMAGAHILDDIDAWSFDGCTWALGYIGGPVATAYLAELAEESPPRNVKSQSVYQGQMSKEDRIALHARAIAEAQDLVSQAKPRRWLSTQMAPQNAAAPAKATAQKPWMRR